MTLRRTTLIIALLSMAIVSIDTPVAFGWQLGLRRGFGGLGRWGHPIARPLPVQPIHRPPIFHHGPWFTPGVVIAPPPVYVVPSRWDNYGNDWDGRRREVPPPPQPKRERPKPVKPADPRVLEWNPLTGRSEVQHLHRPEKTDDWDRLPRDLEKYESPDWKNKTDELNRWSQPAPSSSDDGR